MHLILALFVLTGGPKVDMTGIWKLPTKKTPVKLMLVNTPEFKRNTLAIIRVNSNCDKPVSVPMRGNTYIDNGKITIALQSRKMKLSRDCRFRLSIVATGKLQGKKYKAKSSVISSITCEGKKPVIKVEKMDGTWRKSKITKPMKSTKKPKGIEI